MRDAEKAFKAAMQNLGYLKLATKCLKCETIAATVICHVCKEDKAVMRKVKEFNHKAAA